MKASPARPLSFIIPIWQLTQHASIVLSNHLRMQAFRKQQAQAASQLAALDGRMRYDLGLSDIMDNHLGAPQRSQLIIAAIHAR